MTKGIEYYLIPVNDITVRGSSPDISAAELETLAQSILDAGVLLEPLVVLRTGPESYELIKGTKNYYAALKAQEINPRAAEMVSAFVVESSSLAVAEAQLKLMRVD